MIKPMDADSFDSDIANGICFLKVSSQYCGPCKGYAPIYDQFARENADVKCFAIDAFDQPEIPQNLGIKKVPTTVVFKDGVEYTRFDGLKSLEFLRALKMELEIK